MKNPLHFVVAAALFCASFAAHASNKSIKLYALDCGTIEVFDMAAFSEKGHLSGPATLANPCFLIRHPKGDLLWDTGHDENIADMPEGLKESWGISTTNAKLSDQLTELGLRATDIDYLSLSHWHPDHSGNAGLFTKSTLITHKAEHDFMFADSTRAIGGLFKFFAPLETADTVLYDSDHDVFGDSSVIIKPLPGHTAGHAALLIRLPNTGSVLLSGDLHILQKGRAVGAVPVLNVDKDATRASHAAFEALAQQENARVIVQHDKSDFDALPPFPAYLD